MTCEDRDKYPSSSIKSGLYFKLKLNNGKERDEKGLENIRNCLKAQTLFIHKSRQTKYLLKMFRGKKNTDGLNKEENNHIK